MLPDGNRAVWGRGDFIHHRLPRVLPCGSVSELEVSSREPSERRRAVALARHLRDSEQLTIGQIAQRLGRAPSTVAGYLVDPEGERARGYRIKYQGRCKRCGALTSPKPGVRLCRSCWRESVRKDAGARGTPRRNAGQE